MLWICVSLGLAGSQHIVLEKRLQFYVEAVFPPAPGCLAGCVRPSAWGLEHAGTQAGSDVPWGGTTAALHTLLHGGSGEEIPTGLTFSATLPSSLPRPHPPSTALSPFGLMLFMSQLAPAAGVLARPPPGPPSPSCRAASGGGLGPSATSDRPKPKQMGTLGDVRELSQ